MNQVSPADLASRHKNHDFITSQEISTKTTVNDVHSRLNPTTVDKIKPVFGVKDIAAAISGAASSGSCLSIAGGRHAMGGQQFASRSTLLDTTPYDSILDLDSAKGIVKVESGIQWRKLVNDLLYLQEGSIDKWGIRQKQTGADNLSLGGALSANAHGRGLRFSPIIGDVESFELLDARARLLKVSRKQNQDLFRLCIGGYGLFGVITSVSLRLSARTRLTRNVEIVQANDVMEAFEERIKDGATYGDFQFAIDNLHPDFLNKGILSTYSPTNSAAPEPIEQLSIDNWRRLVYLAHNQKGRAFREYTRHYLKTAGQVYWSDTHQLSIYLDDYHSTMALDGACRAESSEIITEVYVPRQSLPHFLVDLKTYFRQHASNIIYGTVRLIKEDEESYLAWAKQDYACIVLNLHVEHTPSEIKLAERTFQYIYDAAIYQGGSFFLTYHRFARADQILACYPQFADFLALKKRHDPQEIFQSNWYRHYKQMFGI